jgi:predicted nicotinamide N-methyase
MYCIGSLLGSILTMKTNGGQRFRHLDLVEDDVLGFRLLRPRNAEALISEEEFARDEFLPYWAELWPSSVALAEEVGRQNVRGLRTVELGCGLGLPSLVAARAGAEVLATDWAEDAVALLDENASRNGVALEAVLADWREPGLLLSQAPFDLVLAADVLYERRYVDVVLGLLPKLGDHVLVADPGRPFTEGFLQRAAEEWDVEGPANRIYALTRRL